VKIAPSWVLPRSELFALIVVTDLLFKSYLIFNEMKKELFKA
jgi:hypothetical protein